MAMLLFFLFQLLCCNSDTIQFTATTPVDLLSTTTSLGYFDNKCTFTNYLAPDASYYHWFSQMIATFTDSNVYNQSIQQFDVASNNLSKQLPHLIAFDTRANTLTTCQSPKTGDILTCYSDQSCCGGCNYIDCDLFDDEANAPYWQIEETMVTDLYIHSYFDEGGNVQCMNDGYVVSWINALRLDNGWTNFAIKYSTLDLNGTVVVLNRDLFNFTNTEMDVGSNTFSVSVDIEDSLFLMTYMDAKNQSIGYVLAEYNGIDSGLEVKDTVIMFDIQTAETVNLSNVSVYDTIRIDTESYNECCFISLFKAPMNGKLNLMFNMVDGFGLNVFDTDLMDSFVTVMNVAMDYDIIYDAAVTEIKSIGSAAIRYILVVVSYMKSITGFVYKLAYDDCNDVWNVEVLNNVYFVNSNDGRDFWYSFCMNILQNSSSLLMSWMENSFDLLNGDIVNGYAQSWNISLADMDWVRQSGIKKKCAYKDDV